MAKKKYTDDEYLKYLNEQLEKFEKNNDLPPPGSQQELIVDNQMRVVIRYPSIRLTLIGKLLSKVQDFPYNLKVKALFKRILAALQ